MKEYWNKIKDWWATLGIREKKAVSGAGIVLLIFAVYQFLWLPFQNQAIYLRKQIVSNEKTLLWMQTIDQRISATRGNEHAQKTSAVLLLGILQKEIESAGLQQSLMQLKQNNNGMIELHFQKVQFDELMKLLIQINKQHGTDIVQMSALADPSPGIVNADIYVKSS